MSYSLYLYAEPTLAIETTSVNLSNYLIDINLTGGATTSSMYKPGKKLMEYINFLGCSPSLSSDGVDSTIRLHSFDQLTGMGGLSVETIRYPECKHPVDDAARLLNYYSTQKLWKFPACGNQGRINQLNWRKTAGISTLFIEISSIFPKEALPNDKLLQLLKNFSHTNWFWFYSQSSGVS